MQVILKRPGEPAEVGFLTTEDSIYNFLDGVPSYDPFFTPSGNMYFVGYKFVVDFNITPFNMWLGGVQYFGNIFICSRAIINGEFTFLSLSDDDLEDIFNRLDWSDADKRCLMHSDTF